MTNARHNLSVSLVACFACAAYGVVACGTSQPPLVSPSVGSLPSSRQFDVIAQVDLTFGDVRSQELSAIAWDDSTRTLFAISDHSPMIVPLHPSLDLKHWAFGDAIPVSIPDPWDCEGLALLPDGFIVSNEAGSQVYELDRTGHTRRTFELPAHFSRAVKNKSLEALSLSPDGRLVITANESALEGDGSQPTTVQGTTVRILRIDRATSKTVEAAYRTDPVFAEGGGDMGVAEISALSDDDLLVLERSYVPAVGNSIRIYRTSLAGATDVKAVDHLSDTTPVLTKRLVMDLSTPGFEVSPAGSQTTKALYPNYEGMTLGPKLADGRRVLFLISDDNGKPTQVTRLLILASAALP